MKTKINKISMLLIGFFFTIACLFASPLGQQQKPKGKPWPVPAVEEKKKNPLKADESILKMGKDAYIEHCKSCHGLTGKGDGPKAAKIDILCGDFSSAEYQKESEAAIFWKTTEGRKPMPAYKEKLTDKQRWAVVLYIKTFGSK